MNARILIFTVALLCLAGGCAREDALDSIQSRGELVVVSRNSPTTFYQGKNGPTGFEYALANCWPGIWASSWRCNPPSASTASSSNCSARRRTLPLPVSP